MIDVSLNTSRDRTGQHKGKDNYTAQQSTPETAT